MSHSLLAFLVEQLLCKDHTHVLTEGPTRQQIYSKMFDNLSIDVSHAMEKTLYVIEYRPSPTVGVLVSPKRFIRMIGFFHDVHLRKVWR